MKRLALAGALLAAAAPAAALDPEVNLSGNFALSLSHDQNRSRVARTTDVDVENNGSNFRLAAAATEAGVRAFMAYERGASNDQVGVEDVREFFGGASGRYGMLLFGRKATDYRLAGERIDPFYDTSVAGFNGLFASEGTSYGLSNLTNGYASNTLLARTPTADGFSGNVAAYVNDNNSQGAGDKADYALGAGYTNPAWLDLDVGVQTLDLNGHVVAPSPAGNSTAVRLHGSIGGRLWALGASIERIDAVVEDDPRKYYFVAGSWQVLPALRLAAALGGVKDSPSHDGVGGTIGGFYDLTRHLGTYVAVRHVGLTNGNDDKTTTLAAGVTFRFDVDL